MYMHACMYVCMCLKSKKIMPSLHTGLVLPILVTTRVSSAS